MGIHALECASEINSTITPVPNFPTSQLSSSICTPDSNEVDLLATVAVLG